jgi:hypothetical protein
MNNQTLREKIIATNIAKKRGGGKLREEERTPTHDATHILVLLHPPVTKPNVIFRHQARCAKRRFTA